MSRKALVVVALVFGVFETADILDTGIPALVVAILFYACAAWVLRRSSRVAALLVGALCVVEATQAHTWKHASAASKDFAVVAGTVGAAVAALFLAGSLSRQLRLARGRTS
jgi:hypothetical protein